MMYDYLPPEWLWIIGGAIALVGIVNAVCIAINIRRDNRMRIERRVHYDDPQNSA